MIYVLIPLNNSSRICVVAIKSLDKCDYWIILTAEAIPVQQIVLPKIYFSATMSKINDAQVNQSAQTNSAVAFPSFQGPSGVAVRQFQDRKQARALAGQQLPRLARRLQR